MDIIRHLAGNRPPGRMAPTTRRSRAAVLAAGLLLSQRPAVSAVQAADASPQAPAAVISLRPGSTLWLEGTSTLHHFESTATKMNVSFQVQPGRPAGGGAPTALEAVRDHQITGVDLDIPVVDLKSGKSGLDKNMYAALKAKDYPSIHFTLGKYALQPEAARSGAYVLQTSGELSIAGRMLPIEMSPEAFFEGGRLRVRGEKELKMTDFGIKPPTLMLGTLRVGDRVTIHYDLALEMDEGK